MWDEGAHVMWDEGAHVMWDEGAHVVSHLRRFEVLGGLLEPTFTSVPRFCLDPTLPTVHTINSDFLQLHKAFFRVQFQVCTMQIAVMFPLGSLKTSCPLHFLPLLRTLQLFGRFWSERCLVKSSAQTACGWICIYRKGNWRWSTDGNMKRGWDSVRIPKISTQPSRENTMSPSFSKRLTGVVPIVDAKCGYLNVGLNKESSDLPSLLTKGVGSLSSNFVMIPFLTISSYSLLMSSLRLIGTRRGGWITGGTLVSTVMWYSPWNFPMPLKHSG